MSAAAKQSPANETTDEPTVIVGHIVKYDVTELQIAELRTQFAGVTFDEPKAYEIGRRALATLRELRVGVERTRKHLKADSLEYGRKVDSVARHFTQLLEDIENPLQLAKDAVDQEAARIKREKEEAEAERLKAEARAKLEAEEAALKAKRDAEQAELDRQRAELEAEKTKLAKERQEAEAREEAARIVREGQERLAREAREADERRDREAREATQRAEREAEEQRQATERKRLAAVAEEQAAAQRKLDAEREAVRLERERVERAELERVTKERTERETRERIERERVAAEAAANAKAEREAAEHARVEAMRPDVEKLRLLAKAIRGLFMPPDLATQEARAAVAVAEFNLQTIAEELESFEAAVRESEERGAA
jgi:hypothetical protein